MQILQKLPILHITRLHCHSLLCMFLSHHIITGTLVGNRGKEIPPRAALSCRNIIQSMQGLFVISISNIVHRRLHIDRIILLGALLILSGEITKAAETAIAAVCTICTIWSGLGASILITACISLLLFLHDLCICLLNFFKFFFCNLRVRTVDIRIRMILSAEFSVCLFYFFICSTG